jgi:O-antigen biosynthesis protein
VKTLLSVVIAALNSASTISITLKSIFANKYPRSQFEVIVVDNGSSDNTVEVASKFPVRIVHCPNRGIGCAKNYGMRMAAGEIVCFTDSDCYVEVDWLEKIATFFDKNPDVAGMGGPVFQYPFSQTKVQELTGEIFAEEQNYPSVPTRLKYGSGRVFLYGTNSAYRKKALMEVGGLVEPGGSFLKLCWRLTRKNFILVFYPNIRVQHIFSTNLRGVLRQHYRWGAKYGTMVKRNLGVKASLKEIVYCSNTCARRLVSLLVPGKTEKKLLSLIQRLFYSYGYFSEVLHGKDPE